MEVIDGIITGADSLMTRDGILSVPGVLLLASDFTTLSISQHSTLRNVNCSERGYCIGTKDACDWCEGMYPHSSASDWIYRVLFFQQKWRILSLQYDSHSFPFNYKAMICYESLMHFSMADRFPTYGNFFSDGVNNLLQRRIILSSAQPLRFEHSLKLS